MSQPTLSALKTFDAIVRTGSLKGAAQELHITQSAVSHQLRRLEETLERKLVVRSGRGILPTAEGKRLADGLREGFQRLELAVSELTGGQAMRRLRISCLPSIAVRWLIPRLNKFREQYPDIAISIQYASTLQDSITADADVLITWRYETAAPDRDAQRLFSGATYPVASPLYLDQAGPCQTPADLLQMELLHDHSFRPWQTWFKQHGLYSGSMSEGAVYQDFNLLSAAAIAGLGIALCPLTLIETELNQGTLRVLFDIPVSEQRIYWLFHHPQPSSAVTTFCEWINGEVDAI
ncbi:LysR substrate-binding domain-containing protein [Zobellella maritima]|uniref:LysR substrate-binding domain-containing protein n=1 Tax=Zobellella maritima TaxID=2059725 RepID=UPI000E3088EF|nr:LysR substrate-binding domain-containing protein [Zobellella maritima]